MVQSRQRIDISAVAGASLLVLACAVGCSGGDDPPDSTVTGGSAASAAGGTGAMPTAGTTAGAAAVGGDTATAATGAGGEAGMSVAGAGAGGDGSGGAGVGGDGSGGAGAGGDGSGGAGAGGDGAGSCQPDSAFSGPELRDCNLPGACGRCMWEKACASFTFRCARNADCVCAAECVAVAGVGAADSCLDGCGLSESPPGFAEWVKGASDMCWDEGCGVLGEPPPEPGTTTGGSTGGGTEADCAFEPGLPFDPCGEVLQLQSEDGSLCVRIERREEGPGGDANTAWTLLDVRIGPLGQVCHVSDAADICWFSSHHNYADWAHITCGGLHYDLNMAKNCGTENRNPSPTFRLHVFEDGPSDGSCSPTADGSCPVVAPMDLVPAP